MKKILAGVAMGVACMAGQGAAAADSNQKRVLDFWRVVIEARNPDAAKEYLAPGYIQHNPLVPTGREGFIGYFKKMGRPTRPARAELAEAPVVVMAKGDLVMLMWKSMKPEPTDAAKSYESFWFDLFRVKDGWIVEHWDNATK